MDNMTQAWILLLAGFIVVFTVLILLIIIVTLYSKIVTSVQKAGEKKKERKKVVKIEVIEPTPTKTVPEPEENDDEIPGEIIAVIAAAVDAVYGEKTHKIKAVKKSRSSRSAWARAGVLENTKPF